jgi:MoxR-like ATPase
MTSRIEHIVEELERESARIHEAVEHIGTVLKGIDDVLYRLLLIIIVNGSAILVGAPGTAKTQSCHALARVYGARFKKLQFTYTLTAEQLLGYEDEYNERKRVIRGQLHGAQLFLADELPRAHPKAQSALLECMQEKQITLGENTIEMEEPFTVVATRNPFESQETSEHLPEALADRFYLEIPVLAPSKEVVIALLDSARIVHRDLDELAGLAQLMAPADILRIRALANELIAYDRAHTSAAWARVGTGAYIGEMYQFFLDVSQGRIEQFPHILQSFISPRAVKRLYLMAYVAAVLSPGPLSLGAERLRPTARHVQMLLSDFLRHRFIFHPTVPKARYEEYVENLARACSEQLERMNKTFWRRIDAEECTEWKRL